MTARIDRGLFCFLLIVCLPLFTRSQNYYLDQANAAMNEQDFKKALGYLSQEIDEHEKNGIAYYYRSWLYWNKWDDHAKALKDVNLAINYLSKKEKILKAKSYQLRAEIYLTLHEEQKGLSDYEKAIKLNPDNPEHYIDRADYFLQNKDFVSAEKDYRKAVSIDESNVQAIAGLSFILIQTNKNEEAEKCIHKIILLDPDAEIGYRYRAMFNYQKQHYHEAIEDIFQAYILSGEDGEIMNQLLSYSEKNMILAIAKATEKINQYNGVGNMYFVRARLHDKQNNLESAIADYTKMIERSDVSYASQLFGYRAMCYKKGGAFESAFSDATALINTDTSNSYSFYTRSEIYRQSGDYENAMKDLHTAIRINPTEGWFYFSKASIEAKLLHCNEAIEDYGKCIALNPQFVPAYLRRGLLYTFQIKDSLKAKSDFEKILTLESSIRAGSNYRPYVFQIMGERERAKQLTDSMIMLYPTAYNYYTIAGLSALKSDVSDVIRTLNVAFDLGFRDVDELENDPVFYKVKGHADFVNYLTAQKKKYNIKLDERDDSVSIKKEHLPNETVTIPMKSKGNGIYEIACSVNDLRLHFIFDTGASDISISQTEATFMLKNGYLDEGDILGTQRYMDANGTIQAGTRILLRKVDFGGFELKNISASVVNNKRAPLLFGQSALSKYAKIIIDNTAGQITISAR